MKPQRLELIALGVATLSLGVAFSTLLIDRTRDSKPPTSELIRVDRNVASSQVRATETRTAELLRSHVVQMAVSDKPCDGPCIIDALPVASAPETSLGQLCLTNPQLQTFETRDGPVTGVLASGIAGLDGTRIGVPLLIRITEGGGNGFKQGKVCAPDNLVIGSANLRLSGAWAGSESWDPLLIADSGGWRRPLLDWLWGYDSRRVVQIEIRSDPEGAEVIVDGALAPARTNSQIAVPGRSLPGVVLKLRQVRRSLTRCQRQPGHGRISDIYQCDLRGQPVSAARRSGSA
jgi:hypothetical protein